MGTTIESCHYSCDCKHATILFHCIFHNDTCLTKNYCQSYGTEKSSTAKKINLVYENEINDTCKINGLNLIKAGIKILAGTLIF